MFNNLELTLGMNLKFYTSLAKELKLKVRKFWWLVPTFVELTGGKLVRRGLFLPPILNRVNKHILRSIYFAIFDSPVHGLRH